MTDAAANEAVANEASPGAATDDGAKSGGASGADSNDLVLDEGPSTHFNFEHKIFSVPDAYFSRPSPRDPAVLNVPLGGYWGRIPLSTVCQQFEIDPNGKDAQLLQTVELGLNHMREIRPGDNIPREILDGSASWSIEPRHLETAKARLTLQMVAWMTGEEVVVLDLSMLEQVAADPETKRKAQEAFGEAAEQLGIGRENKERVVGMVDKLAREISYIEALREYFYHVNRISKNIDRLVSLYAAEREVVESLNRCRNLIRDPVRNYNNEFDQIDAQSGEVIGALKNLDRQITFIRESRDRLHSASMLWSEMVESWKDIMLEKGAPVESMIKQTYVFLAQNFMIERSWLR